jgi:hypothetical protein
MPIKTFRFQESVRRRVDAFPARPGTMTAHLVQETHRRVAFEITGRESRTGCGAALGYGWE